MNAHESGRVPNPTAELVMAGIVRGSYLTTYGEVVRYYVFEQEVEDIG